MEVGLTEVVSLPQPGRSPLIMEVPVSHDLDPPFLVSSSKGVVWVAKLGVPPSQNVRAAVRRATLSALFEEAVVETRKKAQELSWGSVWEATPEGLGKASSHLLEYGLAPWEVLYGAGFDSSILSETPSREVRWVPEKSAILVPRDRAFLGTSYDFGGGNVALVLHNPSRALAFLV